MANKYETKTPVKKNPNKPQRESIQFYGVRVNSADSKPKVRDAVPKLERYSNSLKEYSLSQAQGGTRGPTVKPNGNGED